MTHLIHHKIWPFSWLTDRNRQLEGILVVAQQFHEALEPLVEWLTATEKRLANAEPIGTQASKLQQQISQHKVRYKPYTCSHVKLSRCFCKAQLAKLLWCTYILPYWIFFFVTWVLHLYVGHMSGFFCSCLFYWVPFQFLLFFFLIFFSITLHYSKKYRP